jgi:hypothetical protein
MIYIDIKEKSNQSYMIYIDIKEKSNQFVRTHNLLFMFLPE